MDDGTDLAGVRAMTYRRLGRTGLKVSAVGLGCGGFGGIGSAPALFGKGATEEEAFAIMDAAWEMGITLFDTADAYGGGRSEAYIGQWLKAKGPRVRGQLLLSTKVLNPVGDGPNDCGLSRLHIMRQVEASLRRMQADWIDLYLIHGPDPETPLEETLRAFSDLVHQGKVRYLGASNMPAWLMTRALWISDRHDWSGLDCVQNSYSLLDRGDEREMFPLCAEQGLGYTPFSPLAGGWLTGKYANGMPYPAMSRMALRPEGYRDHERPEVFAGLERLQAEAARRGLSMAGLALAWVMSHPLVTAPIVGPRRPEHLQPAREALEVTLSEGERREIAGFFR
jgi:aryl-alcohol dehydrogenase-like predicted oxidoreductase